MPEFEIKGKGTKTGRRRTRTYFGRTEEEALRAALKDETEPESVTVLPGEPATAKQLEFARSLNITIPPEISKLDISYEIDIALARRDPPREEHLQFAKHYGLEITEHITKKRLFAYIMEDLAFDDERKEGLIIWFAYRIYRHLVGGRYDSSLLSWSDPVFNKVAQKFLGNDRVLKSIRRYEGRDLMSFGIWISPDGYEHTGASKNTIAYREVSAYLRSLTGLPEGQTRRTANHAPRPKRSAATQAHPNTQENASGCAVVLIAGIPITIFSGYQALSFLIG